MRFFRHGDSLAIVLPEALRKSSGVQDGEDYEFFEAEPGVFILVSKRVLARQATQSVLASLVSRTLNPSEGSAQPRPAVSVSNTVSVQAPVQQAPPKRQFVPGSHEWKIEKEGLAVIENEAEAKRVSSVFEKDIKEGRVLGVRGFDKKYYVMSSEFYSSVSSKVEKALSSKDLPAQEIALEAKIDEKHAIAALQLMRENGEVIEKKRGVYALVK